MCEEFPMALQDIPDHFKTNEMYERVTEKNPSLFVYVPRSVKDMGYGQKSSRRIFIFIEACTR